MNEYDTEVDELGAARGCLIGTACGAACWFLIGMAVWGAFHFN